jgi:surfactin synthase thioesterase subunit
MIFTREVLRKYRAHGSAALEFPHKSKKEVHAFFGMHDHYRRSGVVSIRKWKRLFGETFTLYDGTHFMEEEYIHSLLIPRICSVLESLSGC